MFDDATPGSNPSAPAVQRDWRTIGNTSTPAVNSPRIRGVWDGVGSMVEALMNRYKQEPGYESPWSKLKQSIMGGQQGASRPGWDDMYGQNPGLPMPLQPPPAQSDSGMVPNLPPPVPAQPAGSVPAATPIAPGANAFGAQAAATPMAQQWPAASKAPQIPFNNFMPGGNQNW